VAGRPALWPEWASAAALRSQFPAGGKARGHCWAAANGWRAQLSCCGHCRSFELAG